MSKSVVLCTLAPEVRVGKFPDRGGIPRLLIFFLIIFYLNKIKYP